MLEDILVRAGYNLGSKAAYDIVKKFFFEKKRVNIEDLKEELRSRIKIDNAEIIGEIIQYFADNGDIRIRGSEVSGVNAEIEQTEDGNLVFRAGSK